MKNPLPPTSQTPPQHSKSFQARQTQNLESKTATGTLTKEPDDIDEKAEEDTKIPAQEPPIQNPEKGQTETQNRLELAEILLLQTRSALDMPTLDAVQRAFLGKHVVYLEKEVGVLKVEVLRQMLGDLLGEAGMKKTPDVVDLSTEIKGEGKVGEDGGDGDREESK